MYRSEQRKHAKPQGVPAIDISALMASESTDELARALRDPNGPLRQTLNAIRAAATDWGVFYVTNHGVPRDELARVRRASRAFFELPRRAKHRVRRRTDNARGYFDGDLASDRADRNERFAVAGPHEDSAPRARRVERLFANDQNQWPLDTTLPGFKPAVTSHFASMQRIARRLLMLLAVALGERIDFFDAFFHGETAAVEPSDEAAALPRTGADSMTAAAAHANASTMELTHFPAVRNPEWTLRAHHSTDNSALTLRLEDVGGDDDDDVDIDNNDVHSSESDALQVLHPASQTWRAVAPRRNALVVTVGELLQLWSNDAFVAPALRVFNSDVTARHVATFRYCPSYHAVAQPIALDAVRAKYRPLHWLTHLIAQLEGGFDDADDADAHISGYRIEVI